MTVGFLGLGAMGLPMARRLCGAGYDVCTVVHRRREGADELVELGARILPSAAEVARVSTVVVTILPADRELIDVVLGPGGVLEGLQPGSTLVDMTTAMASTLEHVAEAIQAAGGRVLDAPVSGGTTAAADGTLTIMVGGDAALLDEQRELLGTMGTTIVHVGAIGQGKVVKMVNQTLAALHVLAIGEAFALGVRAGASPSALYDVIRTSSGHSRMMDLRLPGFLLAGKFEPGFRLALMKKDVNLAVETARALDVAMPLAAVSSQLLSAACAAGHADDDFSSAAAFVAGMAGVRLDA